MGMANTKGIFPLIECNYAPFWSGLWTISMGMANTKGIFPLIECNYAPFCFGHKHISHSIFL